MHDFCGREPVKIRGGSMGIGTNIFRIYQVPDLEIRQVG